MSVTRTWTDGNGNFVPDCNLLIFTAQDLRVAELAMKSGCATIVVLNKWDIEDVDLEFTRARVAQKLRLRPKVMTASAKTGRGVDKLLPINWLISRATRYSESAGSSANQRLAVSALGTRAPASSWWAGSESRTG